MAASSFAAITEVVISAETIRDYGKTSSQNTAFVTDADASNGLAFQFTSGANNPPVANPTAWWEVEFWCEAGTYYIWARGKSDGDVDTDAFWLQFDDQIGTTDHTADWGLGNWRDVFDAGVYRWMSEPPPTVVTWTTNRTGLHRVRAQPRQIPHYLDQLLISQHQSEQPADTAWPTEFPRRDPRIAPTATTGNTLNTVVSIASSSRGMIASGDRIISDGSIDPEILVEIRDNIPLNRAYAKEYLGIDPPGCNVFISTNPEWLTDRYFEAFGLEGDGGRQQKMQRFSECDMAAEAGFQNIFFPACSDWLKEPSEIRKWTIAHEWWHTNVQFYLLNTFCCTDSVRMQILGPEWLVEGSAEVWASLVLNDFANNLEQEIAWRRERIPVDFNLLDLNTRQGWREALDKHKYEARDLAVYMLVETAGLPSLVVFYKLLGAYFASEAAKIGLESTNQSYQMIEFRNKFFDSPERYQQLNEIFQSAFGRTMEAFAEEFQESLANPIRTEEVTPPINREEILAGPGENATDTEIQKHGDLVVAAAVNVNIIDISGCTPNPLVIEVGLGESIEIKNDDPIAHTLHHGEISITIPANGEISITIPARGTRGIVLPDFLGNKGPGLYGYGCDGPLRGFFYVNSGLGDQPAKATLSGHTAGVVSVAFSSRGMIASGSNDNTARLWNPVTESTTAILQGHNAVVRSVAFSPDGTTLASGSYDHTIILWDVATGQPKNTLTEHTAPVETVAFSRDGSTLASGSHDGTVILWDVATGQPKDTLRGHTDWVEGVAFSPDGSTLASGSHNGTVILWDAVTGQHQATLTGHGTEVSSVAYSPDGATIATGSGDYTVRLWDAGTGQPKATLTGHTYSVNSVAYSPDGATLATGSGDNTVRLWDAGTGQHQATLTRHTDWVSSVAYSPDGATLASGSSDGTVLLWELIPSDTMTVTEPSQLEADVTGDNVVNIFDLVSVASQFGQTGQNDADVNKDGVVNILDLVTVAGVFGTQAAAPSAHPQALAMLTAADVKEWLTQAQQMVLTTPTYQRGIVVLEQLLAALTPKETALLPNYPNPFNPETWIPYRLAEDAFVTLAIYDQTGKVVRTLDVGHRVAAVYESRSKAIYWDGRNEVGESVASGVYFYHLSAGDYSATRKMLIVK